MNLVTTLFSALFPLVTPGMTPGDVPLTRKVMQVATPICIVGDDDRSLRWLRARNDRLHQVGTVCFAVNVRNERRWQAVLQAASGVPISPVPGTQFIQQFGLQHYPVVITRQGIGQ